MQKILMERKLLDSEKKNSRFKQKLIPLECNHLHTGRKS
jgi:hypothetical protein